MKRIKLNGKHSKLLCVVSDKDYDLVKNYSWHGAQANKSEIIYAQAYIVGNKNVKMHRLILGLTDSKIQADHKDNNGLNNQRSNLRICNHQQNCLNRKRYTNGKFKYRGVYKVRNKWRAQIRFGTKLFHLGYFDNEVDAALSYDEKVDELFGEYANLNFGRQE